MTPKHKESVKYDRDFHNFNKWEFQEELVNIDWTEIVNETEGTEISYQKFYCKLEEILKEIRLGLPKDYTGFNACS